MHYSLKGMSAETVELLITVKASAADPAIFLYLIFERKIRYLKI